MIRIALALVLALLPVVLCAQTARIISGEHADFTRLVVELPTAVDWRLGRTASGYDFVTTGETQPGYDLTGVWDRIPRARLQSLWADPENGALRMTMSCPCHAFPFELRPGVIVIDLRDGPAPRGSVFERALDGTAVRVGDAPLVRPGAAPTPVGEAVYDWLDPTVVERADRSLPPADLPFPVGRLSLDPLRGELLEQLSRGAAEGIVDMKLPAKPGPMAEVNHTDLPWSRFRIGERPGVEAGSDRAGAGAMQADGTACLPDARLAIGDWGTDEAGSVQLANARSGLLGEFDVPDPDAIERTMRVHLFLGFGAEAIQYAALLDPQPADAEIHLYSDLARIIDGMESPASAFTGMLGCDGAASLWAALLYTRLPAGPDVNSAAVVRNFAALPAHLRQHFGAELVDKLLDSGDAEAARMIRDTVARTPWVPAAEVDLLQARADLAAGRPDQAAAHAETAIAGGASGSAPAIALIEAAFRKGAPVPPDLAETVRSFLKEAEGTVAEPDLRRALALALALSGQAEKAVAEGAGAPHAVSDLWLALGMRASDDAFLNLAVVAPGSSPPPTTAAVATLVSDRLVTLGFPEAALSWLGPVDADAAPDRRIIAARAEQARGDSRRALELLQDLSGTEIAAVRAVALMQLGKLDPAMDALRAAGDEGEAQRLLTWQRDWTRLHADGPEVWRAAAGVAVTDTPLETGLLAQGSTLLEDSQSARQVVADLLAAVPVPVLADAP